MSPFLKVLVDLQLYFSISVLTSLFAYRFGGMPECALEFCLEANATISSNFSKTDLQQASRLWV